MSDWKQRLRKNLEPLLMQSDPRPGLSTYHNMPYGIFVYPPSAEFDLRTELSMLRTRLEHGGKRVTVISLAECVADALALEDYDPSVEEEKLGVAKTVETVHDIVAEIRPLDALVEGGLPPDPDPLLDVVLIVRAGSLFPFYRTSSLLEQLMGRLTVPAILFYPGELQDTSALSFMGVLDAEHNYRPRIF